MSASKCWVCQHHQKIKVSDEPLYFASICAENHVMDEGCESFEEKVSTDG